MEFLEVLTEGLERVLLVRGGGSEVITIYSWSPAKVIPLVLSWTVEQKAVWMKRCWLCLKPALSTPSSLIHTGTCSPAPNLQHVSLFPCEWHKYQYVSDLLMRNTHTYTLHKHTRTLHSGIVSVFSGLTQGLFWLMDLECVCVIVRSASMFLIEWWLLRCC